LGFALLVGTGTAGRAAVATVAGTVNIAAAANGGKIVGFSSEALDEHRQVIKEWQISNLLDGKYVVGNYTPADSYGWQSETPPSDDHPEWFVVAFTNPATGKETTHLISRVVVDPTTDDPPIIGRWVQGITLQVSSESDKGPWTEVGKYLVVNRAVKQTFDFPPTEARYVRVLITSNHGSDRCVEMGQFEVYEAIVAGEQLDNLIIQLENLLADFKRLRDGQLYKQQQENTEAVTAKAPPPVIAPGPPGPTPPAPTPPVPTPPAPTPPTPVAPAKPAVAVPPGPAAGEPVSLGALSLVIAPGWTKQEGAEMGEDVKLVLGGPQVGGSALVFIVSVQPVAAGTNLLAYAASVAKEWPQGIAGDSKTVKLAGTDARYLVLTSDGKAFLSYCLVRGGQGITLTAVAPAAAVDEAEKALAPLYDSVKLL
jgi:hypothetical protein